MATGRIYVVKHFQTLARTVYVSIHNIDIGTGMNTLLPSAIGKYQGSLSKGMKKDMRFNHQLFPTSLNKGLTKGIKQTIQISSSTPKYLVDEVL